MQVLHVMTASEAEEGRTASYWRTESEKIISTRPTLKIDIQCVQVEQNLVKTIVSHCADSQLIVMASLELVKVKQDSNIALGSVAQAVAKQSKAHACIIKNFSCI